MNTDNYSDAEQIEAALRDINQTEQNNEALKNLLSRAEVFVLCLTKANSSNINSKIIPTLASLSLSLPMPKQGDEDVLVETILIFTQRAKAELFYEQLGDEVKNYNIKNVPSKEIFTGALDEGLQVCINKGSDYSRTFSFEEIFQINEIILKKPLDRNLALYQAEKKIYTRQLNNSIKSLPKEKKIIESVSDLLDNVEEIFNMRLAIDPIFKESAKSIPLANNIKMINYVWRMILTLGNAYSVIIRNNLTFLPENFAKDTGFVILKSTILDSHHHLADILAREVQMRFSISQDNKTIIIHGLEFKKEETK
jgi:hypothetical protein